MEVLDGTCNVASACLDHRGKECLDEREVRKNVDIEGSDSPTDGHGQYLLGELLMRS